MLARRRFLFLLGGVTAGLWLPTTGLVPIDRGFVLKHAGNCSFCGKRPDEVDALLGTLGGAPRICSECLLLCCEIVREAMANAGDCVPAYCSLPVVEVLRIAEERRFEQIRRMMAARESRLTQAERQAALLEQARRQADFDEVIRSLRDRPEPPPEPQPVTGIVELRCSFCGAARSDVAKLISGPRVFICDVCTGEALAVISRVLAA